MTRQEAITKLQEILKPGDTVYSVVRHVSQSGRTRVIDFYIFQDNKPLYLSGYIAAALDMKRANKGHWGIKVSGCGMDMCFHVVYSLSMTLYCPDKYDHDAAYSLKSEVL